MSTSATLPLQFKDAKSDWLEKQLSSVRQNLLQRPQRRRGPFIIDDIELEERDGRLKARTSSK